MTKEEKETSKKEEILDENFEKKSDEKKTVDLENFEKHQKLETELKECQNKYLRLLAEAENARKRMTKEKTDSIKYMVENTVCEFLPILDNFENALNLADKGSEEVKKWATGFKMILSQFKDVLFNHDIIAFHSVGNNFDPHFHDAMEIEETIDHPEGIILEEFAKGYKSSSRTIRPARVKVAKKPNEIKEEVIKKEE